MAIDFELIRKVRQQLTELRAKGILPKKGYDLVLPFSRPIREVEPEWAEPAPAPADDPPPR